MVTRAVRANSYIALTIYKTPFYMCIYFSLKTTLKGKVLLFFYPHFYR